MKVGRPEGESTVVGYPMPLAVAISFAMVPMTTSIEAGWNYSMILVFRSLLFF